MEDVTAEVAEVEDVEETTQETEVEQELARDKMLDELADKIKATRTDDSEAPEDEDDIEEDAEEQPDEEPEMVQLKVDGEIIEKTPEEVEAAGGITAYQMTLAADKRFKEAAAEKEELAQLRADLQRQAQELEEVKAAKEEVKPAEIPDEIVDEFITSVYSGDEDKAKESFKAAIARLTPAKQPETPKIDTKEVIDGALYRMDQEQGIKQFAEEYEHLNNDPRLRGMVNEATARIVKASPDKKPSIVIMEAAKEVDTWIRSLSPAETILEEQVEKKKNLKPIKAAKARVQRDTGYKPKTQAEIFEEQRANRSR